MHDLVSESLQIVGEELAVTLSDIRMALEQYADGEGGPQSMERCLRLLHSAKGALRLTETYGASLLAEEMEDTCLHLGKSRRPDAGSEEAVEALSRAAVQLPDYVERIINGGRDVPLVLLPLLNDLRAARGRALLSESTLLLLNISSPSEQLPSDEDRQISGENVAKLCVQLRSRFQLGLLGWIKEAQAEADLRRMGDVAERLEKAAIVNEVFQLWWVVGGVIEALLDKGLETSVSMKRLMGQADREMKRLPTVGEEKYAEHPPAELINNLLFYIARSTSEGIRVKAIRYAFNLTDLLPGDAQVEAVRESLAAPNIKLMQTVAQAIRDDLARVKDVLDIFVRTGMDHVEELVPQIELLKKIGDTMGVLGLGEQREIIQSKCEELQSIVESDDRVDEAALVAMAAALLNIEDGLDDQLLRLISPDYNVPAEAEPEADESDFLKVTQAVMSECIINLARVKEAVTQVLEEPDEGSALDSVPQKLRGVIAGLLMLDKEAAIKVVEGIDQAINDFIKQGYDVSDRQRLDLLADAIVSLEYYLETLEAGRKEPMYMLDNAQRCLQVARETERPAMPDLREAEVSSQATTMQVSDYEPTMVADDRKKVPPVPVVASDKARLDSELLELFIEEAGEEIESINSKFPVWENEESEFESLTSVRRSFHTLKGSGRMVGAELIGEYCWNIENLFNRLINKTLERTPAMVRFLRQAIDALPQLLEQLEVGTNPQFDIPVLMQQATAFAKGEDAAAIGESTGAPALSETVESESEVLPEAEHAESEMDPALLEVLSKEVGTHLAVIRAFVEECRIGTPPFTVREELYRACHTLHGSVTMANAAPAAEITLHLNQMIRRAFDHSVAVDDSVIAVCEDVIGTMEAIIECLAEPGRELPDSTELQTRMQGLDAEIEAAVALAETEEEIEETILPEIESEIEEAELRSDELEVELPEFEEPAEAAHDSDFDMEIAAIFSDEAAEILEDVDAAISGLTSEQIDDRTLAALQRNLHTLKGGARMAGLSAMGNLSHDLETLLTRVGGGLSNWGRGLLDLLQASVDELHRMREQVLSGVLGLPSPELLTNLQRAMSVDIEAVAADPEAEEADEIAAEDEAVEIEEIEEAEEAEPIEKVEAAEEVEPVEEVEEPTEMAASTQMPEETPDDQAVVIPSLEQIGQLARELQEPAKPVTSDLGDLVQPMLLEPSVPERRDVARVEQSVLEELLNNAGEISIFHSRLSQQTNQIQFNLDELGRTVVRLKEQLRALEMATEAQILYQHQSELTTDEGFDPLELDRYSRIQHLSRALAETASDVNSLKDLLQNLTGDTEALLVQQARTASELQDGLMRTRMVPFEQHVARLARLVRQTAAEYGKQAELSIRGGGEIDRQVLEKMLPPFEHMLRNAVVHGIELPEDREAAGKSQVGSVVITVRREGTEVAIEIADDGRGLDVDSIRRKAEEFGFIDSGVDVTDEEAMQLILRSGFSTADTLTQAAGRGVGMDVVANEVAKLGGTLRIDSEFGQGATFLARLPFTLAVTQALIVRASSEQYAIPLPTVEGIIRVSREEFDKRLSELEPSIEYGGHTYEFRHLGQYLGLGPSKISEDEDRVSIILVRAGDNSTALVADEMLESREIVVKPLGDQLASIRGISGATILGDGRIVVILDVGALVRSARPPVSPADVEPEEEIIPEQPLALVVDDSITMRRVTERLLERNGMRVMTAKDGIEAMGIMQDHKPDIILLDVEMPRMDGYEFASHVRADPESQDVPIIMVTSRVSDKHKARAIELGVNDYLGKPYQERTLLDAMHHLLHQE